jgi:glycosyltransferase involved in cell wall biosynthesis
MMTVGISFTNFGPYHLARLRALAQTLASTGGRLIAYETAGAERTYPWVTEASDSPYTRITLFPGRVLEEIAGRDSARAIQRELERDPPHAVLVAGYARPESMAALAWARGAGRPAILMSETQRIDHPRVWWKEAVKRQRVRGFAAGLVGGPRHRAYLAELGLPIERIALGYNAVDNMLYAAGARRARNLADPSPELPANPYFLAVNRFVREKNLVRLIQAFAQYRRAAPEGHAWDLVLCGDGPDAAEIRAAAEESGVRDAIHFPGFLQARELTLYYAFASAFVHPSVMEPWGLVVNEAAACGLPLLVSNRAGCAETLVPEPSGTAGWRFDPYDVEAITGALAKVAALPVDERQAMGRRAARVVADWGPERFARGAVEALELAFEAERARRRRTAAGDFRPARERAWSARITA